MSSPHSCYTHHPDVAWRRIQEEALLVDPHTGRIYPLNPVAARIWVLLGEGHPVSAVNQALGEEFDAPPDTVQDDTSDFITRLLGANLLVERPGQPEGGARSGP
jgi:hypothetical protein